MARQRFAPDHSITARARFIPRSDSAWDVERINAELSEMRRAAGFVRQDGDIGDPVYLPGTGHPVALYLIGTTRYDLDAGDVRSYLDWSKKPEVWRLRRLALDQREEVFYLLETDRVPQANRLSFLWGVDGLEGGPEAEPLAKLLGSRPSSPDAGWDRMVLDALGAYSVEALSDVAFAVRRLSQDLAPHEKKA